MLAGVADRPDEAQRILEQAARLRPPTNAYHLRTAEYSAQAGDASGAKKARAAADALAPATALDHYLLGKEQYRLGDFHRAARHLDTAVELHPDHFWARCFSSLCRLREQPPQPAVAKASLTACIASKSAFPWLYVFRGFASYQLAAAAGKPPKNRPPQPAEKKGDDAELDFQAAETDYRRALALLEQQPDDVLRWATLVNRGDLFFLHEDWEKAAADFKAAIRLDERRTQPFVGLARVLLAQHKHDEAYQQYSHAIALQPDYAPLFRDRAEALVAGRNATQAEIVRREVTCGKPPGSEKPGRMIGRQTSPDCASLLCALGRYDEALVSCDEALKVGRDRPDTHQLRIQVLLDLKRYEDVKRSCDALLAKNKSFGALYELRGLARTEVKDRAGAIEDYTQAIALEPGRGRLYVRRGDLYLIDDVPKLRSTTLKRPCELTRWTPMLSAAAERPAFASACIERPWPTPKRRSRSASRPQPSYISPRGPTRGQPPSPVATCARLDDKPSKPQHGIRTAARCCFARRSGSSRRQSARPFGATWCRPTRIQQ